MYMRSRRALKIMCALGTALALCLFMRAQSAAIGTVVVERGDDVAGQAANIQRAAAARLAAKKVEAPNPAAGRLPPSTPPTAVVVEDHFEALPYWFRWVNLDLSNTAFNATVTRCQ
jgi:hypothetical protein